jgi:hypothetical protein
VAGRRRRSSIIRRPFVVSLTGGSLLTGTARTLAAGGSEVLLDGGSIARSDRRASGRVGVAVYPWEVTVGAPGTGHVNALTAPVSAIAPEGGRLRVRVGALTAEGPREELERLGLRRGDVASASFSPADPRLIALED